MDSGYERLEDQIVWFDIKSLWHQGQYNILKVISIVAAALVPLTAAFTTAAWVPGGLGVIVVIVESWQQLQQHHRYWVQYRQTCERLRREKFLYLGRTGTYNLPEAQAFRLLVENVEALISDDSASWLQGRRESEQKARQEPDGEAAAPAPHAS